MDTVEQGRTKHRAFTYKTATEWTDGTSGTLSAEGRPSLRISSPPEFRGEAGMWTPEDMFVASVEICHMSTFLSFARRKDLQILSYKSHANGILEYIDGDYRFTRIVIFPTIVVASATPEAEVHATLRDTQKHCLVANSIASIVEVNPTLMMQ